MERSLTSVELENSLEKLLNLINMIVATVGVGGELHAAAV
jgi:hypothetical protein